MLYNAKNILDNKIQAIDGEIGNLDDFYFDDQSWGIRYMVIDTGNWIEGQKVLISPVVIQNPDISNKYIMVNLNKDQIRNSPDIDTKRPVSQQHEADYIWPAYGIGSIAPLMIDPGPISENKESFRSSDDPHLRSADEVFGYDISALDGEIGHIDDMIIDDDTWNIHFWVVKTKNWLPGKKVLISPKWITKISWEDKKVFVDATVDSIKNSPEYDPSRPLELEYESELNSYYGRTRINN
jgi:uncharacterized protein YrrD